MVGARWEAMNQGWSTTHCAFAAEATINSDQTPKNILSGQASGHSISLRSWLDLYLQKDLALILDGSRGSTHCRDLAVKAGIHTETFTRSTPTMRPYKRVRDELRLDNVRMIWRNFAGVAKQYNDEGKRNFAIPLEQELAEELIEIGWNVKEKTRVNDEGQSETLYHLPVTVKWNPERPLHLFMVTQSKNIRTPLDEVTINLLDYVQFETVDLILRPFNWSVNGNKGVTAYLKTGFFTIREDPLELKYAHIPIEGSELLMLDMHDDIVDVESSDWIEDDAPKELEA